MEEALFTKNIDIPLDTLCVYNVTVSLQMGPWINSLSVNSSLVLLWPQEFQFSPFGPSACRKYLAKNCLFKRYEPNTEKHGLCYCLHC